MTQKEQKITQKEQIIDYLERNGSITPLQAEKELGIMRLASRIWDIQNSGYIVERRIVKGINRVGKVTKYAQYYLPGRV